LSEGERRRLERLSMAANLMMTYLCQDFRVPPAQCPMVTVASGEEVREKCGADACGCYLFREGEIILSPECAELKALLHEFCHHLQFLDAGGDPKRAYSDFDKPHCQRPHEREAKLFETIFRLFYGETWDKVKKKAGVEHERGA